jgi:hypothetical protein
MDSAVYITFSLVPYLMYQAHYVPRATIRNHMTIEYIYISDHGCQVLYSNGRQYSNFPQHIFYSV